MNHDSYMPSDPPEQKRPLLTAAELREKADTQLRLHFTLRLAALEKEIEREASSSHYFWEVSQSDFPRVWWEAAAEGFRDRGFAVRVTGSSFVISWRWEDSGTEMPATAPGLFGRLRNWWRKS